MADRGESDDGTVECTANHRSGPRKCAAGKGAFAAAESELDGAAQLVVISADWSVPLGQGRPSGLFLGAVLYRSVKFVPRLVGDGPRDIYWDSGLYESKRNSREIETRDFHEQEQHS